jgi:hypothetical protein
MSEESLLERVTAASEERHLSQNTLTTYRRTYLRLIAWSAAEGLILQALPSERTDVLWQRRSSMSPFQKPAKSRSPPARTLASGAPASSGTLPHSTEAPASAAFRATERWPSQM